MTISTGKEGTGDLWYEVTIELNKILSLYATNQILLETEYLCQTKILFVELQSHIMIFGGWGH